MTITCPVRVTFKLDHSWDNNNNPVDDYLRFSSFTFIMWSTTTRTTKLEPLLLSARKRAQALPLILYSRQTRSSIWMTEELPEANTPTTAYQSAREEMVKQAFKSREREREVWWDRVLLELPSRRVLISFWWSKHQKSCKSYATLPPSNYNYIYI